jgi:N-6 DNA Methylase
MRVKDEINLHLQQDSERTKRLGQYFTGIRLAKLLATLSEAQNALSIIDPMSGDGDMIEACRQIGAKAKTVVGIEIDPIAHKRALLRFEDLSWKHLQFILGNAFSLESLKKLPTAMYDLVITNPPYVRYQSQTHSRNGDVNLPDARSIRKTLSEIVDSLPALDETDRRLFRQLIKHYSGLSDLAVPAWLLCAMLTRVNGTLAMVVPDAWLSRDYAQAIQYLLLRWFKIIYVVEDDHASWFRNALVKTTLLVAKRIERRDSAFSWENEGFLLTHLSSETMNDTSIVGRLFPGDPNPESRFAELLSKHAATKGTTKGPLVSLEWVSLRQTSQNLKRGSIRNRWLTHLEDTPRSFEFATQDNENDDQIFLHSALCSWLGKNSQAQFLSPSFLGLKIGQGLRTGANQFFYVDLLSAKGPFPVTVPAPVFGIANLLIPADCLLPVLRKQSELPANFKLNVGTLSGRTLVLQKYALPEDIKSARDAGNKGKFWETMPDELARFVRIAAETNVGTLDEPKYVPGLSAVKTNVRNAHQVNSQCAPRFWYMLPDFAERHRPDLFVARVNNLHPKTYLNSHEHILIDANFSTLWLEKNSPVGAHALLAMLNSTWCVTAMELAGTVMGGGALKLEATHLRRLPIPRLTSAQWSQLDTLGKQLSKSATSRALLDTIDRIVISAIQGSQSLPLDIRDLERLKREQLTKRSKR